jgi:hypothetical protein
VLPTRLLKRRGCNMSMTLPIDSDGKLSAYAWPGGYPLFYFDAENNVLCVTCARKDGYGSPIVACDVNWEDTELICDDCYQLIESAYGEE